MTQETINSEQIIRVDGQLYYRLRMQCPVCLEMGKNPEMKYWTHGGCGGDIYVGEDASFYCRKCNEKGKVIEYGDGCPLCTMGSSNLIGKGLKHRSHVAAIAQAISYGGGLESLENFIINLRKQF